MKTFRVMVVVLLPLLAACETPTTQRYAVSVANNQAIRTLNTSGIAIGEFTPPAAFDPACRALGPLRVADGLTHTQYIQRAFEDELKMAGAYAARDARVTLNGEVTTLTFSSVRAMVGGSWTIGLTLRSSNGRSLAVSEYYEFESGFSANAACKETADAFVRAVQNVVGKAVGDSGFSELIR
jgi:hypothetical protein